MPRQYDYTTPNGIRLQFREPLNADRTKTVDYLREGGPAADELLAFQCITRINGNLVRDPDPRYLAQNWPLKDSAAYLTLFMAMFSLSRQEVDDIQAFAKKLKEGTASAQPVSTASAQQSATVSTQTSVNEPVQSSNSYLAGDLSDSGNTTQPGSNSGSGYQIEPSLESMLPSD